MPHTWDPDRYLAWADERGRPFLDLVARVDASSPGLVVDLGCGPGNLTDLLADRWPGGAGRRASTRAREMVARAAARGSRVRYEVGDLRDWAASVAAGLGRRAGVERDAAVGARPPGLLPALVRAVRPGGWFALQVPGNVDEPSHVLTRALAAEEPYAAHTSGAAQPDAHGAATYLEALSGLGCAVDAWETTYLHVLTGPDPVLSWISRHGRAAADRGAAGGPSRRPARAVHGRARRAAARGLPRARRAGRPAVPPGVRRGGGRGAPDPGLGARGDAPDRGDDGVGVRQRDHVAGAGDGR